MAFCVYVCVCVNCLPGGACVELLCVARDLLEPQHYPTLSALSPLTPPPPPPPHTQHSAPTCLLTSARCLR